LGFTELLTGFVIYLLHVVVDLSNIYELLLPVEDSLDGLAMEFEEHLNEIGVALMQSLQEDNVCFATNCLLHIVLYCYYDCFIF